MAHGGRRCDRHRRLAVESFGQQAPFKRPGQPAELAPIYVMRASDDVSYVSGAIIPATGGKAML